LLSDGDYSDERERERWHDNSTSSVASSSVEYNSQLFGGKINEPSLKLNCNVEGLPEINSTIYDFVGRNGAVSGINLPPIY